MKELDLHLAEALTHGRDELDRRHGTASAAVKPEVFRRARRRGAARRSATGVLAVGVVAGAMAAATSLSSALDRGQQPAARGPVYAERGGGSAGGDHDGLGLWPTVEAGDATPYCDDLLEVPQAVASQFANALLTWNNVAIKEEERNGDLITMTISNLPSTYVGGPLPPHTEVVVELERLGDERCWWVTRAWTALGGDVTVTRAGDDLGVRVAFPPDTERAEVVSVDTADEKRGYAVGDPGEKAFRIADFRGPGYVLALWRAADGAVLGATGVTIPR